MYVDVGYAQNFYVGAKGGGERGWDCTWLRRIVYRQNPLSSSRVLKERGR